MRDVTFHNSRVTGCEGSYKEFSTTGICCLEAEAKKHVGCSVKDKDVCYISDFYRQTARLVINFHFSSANEN